MQCGRCDIPSHHTSCPQAAQWSVPSFLYAQPTGPQLNRLRWRPLVRTAHHRSSSVTTAPRTVMRLRCMPAHSARLQTYHVLALRFVDLIPMLDAAPRVPPRLPPLGRPGLGRVDAQRFVPILDGGPVHEQRRYSSEVKGTSGAECSLWIAASDRSVGGCSPMDAAIQNTRLLPVAVSDGWVC